MNPIKSFAVFCTVGNVETLPVSHNNKTLESNTVHSIAADSGNNPCQQSFNPDSITDCCTNQSIISKESTLEEMFDENATVEVLDNESEQLSDQVSVYGEEFCSEQIISEEEYVVIYTSEQSSDTVLENIKTKDTIDHSECKYEIEVSGKLSLTNKDIDRNKDEFTCDVCFDVFENEMTLFKHTNTAHFAECSKACKNCLKVFKTSCEMQKHNCTSKAHIIKCLECTQDFESQKLLRLHMRNAHTKRTCFSNRQSRKVIIHKCDFCTEILPNSHQLIEHGKLVHPSQFILHPCDRCEKSFGNVQSIRSHLLAHDKNYECRHCGKLCPTAVSLAGHENTHTRDQPFQCSQCGRSFAQYTSMRRHMKIHFNEKAYQCDLCSKNFRQRSVMLTHRRIHTGEKPFTCKICDRSFRDHSTLAKHKKLHIKANQNKS
ncbi:zinc finger protein OZF-like isoform X2 [Wyeomyia smithii]|uniref:zinc finger protein OZF-like isoform X2 n=1 Tax=Wyeomyia smithii TaxID=174621 RepID=UPI002467B038|nr:zinc finger protein OZF-like isoform X2 [Wyeomyia smithii]XP_055543589.1 zinc finger protein OZF-like isoform X2 [Wyeomyia smithii]